MSIDTPGANQTLNAEQVESFLQEHPEFFQGREDLLLRLTLPHNSGKAVSLVEKQMSLYRERNQDLRKRLTALLDNAHQNDLLFEKTRTFILSVLAADNTATLLQVTKQSLLKDFAVEYMAIHLFNGNAPQDRYIYTDHTSTEIAALQQILGSGDAVCGLLDKTDLQRLFPQQHQHTESAAVSKIKGMQTLGLIAVGSNDEFRYRSSMGTLFLGFIGEVLGLLLPKTVT